MYSVGVRDHVMIAHSFQGEVFGPAQKLHGATFIIDCEFRGMSLAEGNILVDIGRASETLKAISAELSYQNLDDARDVQGHQHHDRVPGPACVRPHAHGDQGRHARPRRRRGNGDEGHPVGEPHRLGRLRGGGLSGWAGLSG